MPSHIDEAGHTKAFGYPVAEHWGESRNVQFRRWDSNRQHISPESNVSNFPNQQDAKKSCSQVQGEGEDQQENQERGRRRQPPVPTPPPADEPADEPAAEVEEDVGDLAADLVAAESVATESVAGDVGDDELAASSQFKSKKARVLSNLTEKEQEDVALFLERNDFIYNKRRTDHIFASKKNKAWEDLAREMGKEVKALTIFFESIRTQMGKLRRKKSGQAAVEMTDRQQWIWTRFQFLLPHIGLVTRRTVQSFQSGTTTSQGEEESQEEEPQSPVTTIPSTTTPGSSTVTVSSTRGARGRMREAETLDQELHTCKDRQEKLLQILQAPAVPKVLHPERLKFAEYRRPCLTFCTTLRSSQIWKQEDQHQQQQPFSRSQPLVQV